MGSKKTNCVKNIFKQTVLKAWSMVTSEFPLLRLEVHSEC